MISIIVFTLDLILMLFFWNSLKHLTGFPKKALLTDRSQSFLLAISFMHMKSRSGASTELWGTPGCTVWCGGFSFYHCTIRLHAGNVLVYREINTDADTIYLQNNLHTLKAVWQVKFNPSKCVHLVLTRKKSRQMHSQQIQQNKSAKYLRVAIDNRLTWKEHVSITCSKAINAKAFMQRHLYHCPASLKSTCYVYIYGEANTRICSNSMVPTPTVSEATDQ